MIFGLFVEMHSNCFDVIELLINVSRRVFKEAHSDLGLLHVGSALLHQIVVVLLILLLVSLELLVLSFELSDLLAH